MRMSDFDYDCLQKKRLARQASHRKCGSKSKRCTLSTDHMTQKQWEERNGKIVSVSFDKPTTWDNFRELSKSAQEEYLRYLAAEYNANTTNLAEMFGMSVSTVRRHIQSADLDVRFRVGHSMNSEQRAAWERFLHSTNECVEVETEIETDDTSCEESEQMEMREFSLSFAGKINMDMVANSLKHILGNNASGEIKVICSLDGCG